MKLAKIEHSRCGEYDGATLVWIPDEMGEDALSGIVTAAKNALLQAERDLKSSLEADPGPFPAFHKHPDKTVREVQTAHQKLLDKYNEWYAKIKLARKPFAHFLSKTSNGLIKEFWDLEFRKDLGLIVVEAYWGHQHGLIIDTSETDTTSKDFNSPVR